MPIFFQHSINEDTELGIWKIEEAESFFLAKVPLQQQVTHPYKRLQHLAGRYLLPVLFDNFPLSEIRIAKTRKPFLHNDAFHFSISHCGNYAAAIVSRRNRVGVDIEFVTPRMYAISHKFLSDDERRYLDEWRHLSSLHLELTTVVWSAKEAIYKWFGSGGLDFRRDMCLSGPVSFLADESIQMPFRFQRDGVSQGLTIHARMFGQLVLAQVVTGA